MSSAARRRPTGMRNNTTVLGGDGGVQVWGSSSLARQLVEHDLVDEYCLMLEPILLGGGKTLFPSDGRARKLELVSVTQAKTGVPPELMVESFRTGTFPPSVPLPPPPDLDIGSCWRRSSSSPMSLRLAGELRQTADDLTRFARMHLGTGARRYRDAASRHRQPDARLDLDPGLGGGGRSRRHRPGRRGPLQHDRAPGSALYLDDILVGQP